MGFTGTTDTRLALRRADVVGSSRRIVPQRDQERKSVDNGSTNIVPMRNRQLRGKEGGKSMVEKKRPGNETIRATFKDAKESGAGALTFLLSPRFPPAGRRY